MAAPDFTSLISGIDFSSAASGILHVGAAVAGALLSLVGVGMVHASITGKPFNLYSKLRAAGYPDKDAAYVSSEAEGGPEFAGRAPDPDAREVEGEWISGRSVARREWE